MSSLKVMAEGFPAGVKFSVILSAKPQSTEEFEQVVEAAGGPENFTVGADYVHAEINGGALLVEAPPAPAPPRHPLIEEFAERIREAKS